MKDDPNSLARRNALKRIGATAVTGLSLALHPSSEAGQHKVSGVKAEQPAKKEDQPKKDDQPKNDDQLKKKDEKSKKKPDTNTKKPIAELVTREKANLLTPKARSLTKQDLLALGNGERTVASAHLTAQDIHSLKTVFGTTNPYLHAPPTPGCCCCSTPCCCCSAAAAVPSMG